jgi:SPP1 gp7 family putative phage head morphogenesis protein
MSRRSNRARGRAATSADIEKAVSNALARMNLPGTGTIQVRTEGQQRQQSMVDSDGMSALARYVSTPMPRDPRDLVPFGPSHPLTPVGIDPSRPDTGRPMPRISEYDVADNLPGVGDHHHVAWHVLRNAANVVDIMRRCIELRKDHVAPLKWAFTVSPQAVAAAYDKNPNAGKSDLERELREQFTPEINRLTEFWQKPWKTNGLNFAQWTRGMMEQHLVYDGVWVYPETSLGGDLLALNLIDAPTMKPLRDERGQTPMPPYPAYQQMLYGFPRGEFTATVEDDGTYLTTPNAYLADQMYYFRKNFRVESMYGMSPTENALISARLYLKRQGWMISEYDDGVVPEMIIKATETLSLTPKERREYEDTFNDDLTGQTPTRHRAKFLFPGTEPVLLPSVDERYKSDYDLFLIKLVASHYGVSMTSLGFTESKGLGSAGMHEAQADSEEIASIDPDEDMIASLVNELSHLYVGCPPEVVFTYVSDEGDDTLQGEQAYQILLNSGQATINDGRRRLGQPIFNIPEADMPFILGGTNGVTFLEGSFASQQAGRQMAANAASTGPDGQPGTGDGKPTAPGNAGSDNDADPQSGAQPVEKSYAGPDHDIAMAVHKQLQDDYPPEAMTWIKAAHWRGPISVPFGHLDTQARDSWAASHEPERVAHFAKRQKQGKAKPAVLVQKPGSDLLTVIDGHHRALAAERNGMPLLAYVGKVGAKAGAWDEMHASQIHDNGASVEPVSAPPAASKAYGDLELRRAERAAYRRFAAKRARGREFVFKHHDAAEVAEIVKAAGGEAGGDPDPKAPAPGLPTPPPDSRWPGWLLDTALATLLADRIRQLTIAGVDTSALSDAFARWSRAWRKGDPVPNIASWLSQQDFAISAGLGQAIREGLAEAYAMGVLSAQAALSEANPRDPLRIEINWQGWKPGNVRAARRILSENGAEVGLQKLLDQANVVISRISANRLDEVAAVLADGLEEGKTPQQIALALRGVLDDRVWALTVAWTETNRAQSAAALDQYRAAGRTAKEWMTANDQRVCPICMGNEMDGPIPLDADFSSGEQHPPGHPRCRCSLIPGLAPSVAKSARAIATGNEANTERLHRYWTRGPGLGKWFGHVHPWTALRDHLSQFMDLDEANRTATVWFHEVTGTYPNTGGHHH